MSTQHVPVWKVAFCFIGLCLLAPILVSASPMDTTVTAGQGAMPLVGDPFAVTSTSSVSEFWSAVAYDFTRELFLVVYGAGGTITAQCMTNQGQALTGYSVGLGSKPDVAYNPIDDQYLVVYEGATTGIEANTVAGSCCLLPECLGTPFEISDDRPGGTAHEVPAISHNLKANSHDYLVVWSETVFTPSVYTSVLARRVNANRTFDTASMIVATDPTLTADYTLPDVTYNPHLDEWLIVYARDPDRTKTEVDLFGRLFFAASNTLEGAEEAIDSISNNQTYPAVATNFLDPSVPYLVVYNDYWVDSAGDISGMQVDANGTPVTWIQIAGQPAISEARPDVTADTAYDGFTVVWQRRDGDNPSIFTRKVNRYGGMESLYHVSAPYGATSSSTIDMNARIAGDSMTSLVVWEQAVIGEHWDIYGRFLGYRVYVPLTVRTP